MRKFVNKIKQLFMKTFFPRYGKKKALSYMRQQEELAYKEAELQLLENLRGRADDPSQTHIFDAIIQRTKDKGR